MAALQKTIKVGDREVTFRASALSPQAYKILFKRDFFKDLENFTELQNLANVEPVGEDGKLKDIPITTENYEQFMRIAFCMAFQACGRGLNSPKHKAFLEEYPDMWAWLDSFETFSLFEVLPQILELWGVNAEARVKAKNASPIPPER